MYINEIASGSEVSIEVKNKEGKELTLSAQIVGAYENAGLKMVLVEALRHEGQILVFNSVSCQAAITNADDSKVYRYKLQAVLKRELEGKVYHCLISNEDVAEENRRAAKRFGVSAKANIQVMGTTNVLKGYVRDISATGIAVLVGESKIEVGDKIAVSFEHEVTGAQLRVVAQIVRKAEQDKGILYGCLVQKHDAKYTMLLAYLMRQECKTRR